VRFAIVLGLCAACGPGERIVEPDAGIVLPAGVWQPAPGAQRGPTAVALGADGTLWWAFTQQKQIEDLNQVRTESHVWLTQTTATGAMLMTPVLVDAAERSAPQIVVTDRGVAVATENYFAPPTYLYLFDRNGVAQATHEIAVGDANDSIYARAFVGAPDGSLRIVAGIESTTAEVTVVEVDPSGVPGTTTRLGTPDDGSPQNVAAHVRGDDSLVFAWDRIYDQCQGPRPAQTLATRPPDSVVTVGDKPERGEWWPLMAAAGDALYVAWIADMYSASAAISLARYPDVGTPLGTIGDANGNVWYPQLAVAAPERGAVAWLVNGKSIIEVASFEDRNGTFVVGAPHVLPRVVDEGAPQPVGLVHVGDERYVIAWLEAGRLFATQLDLSMDERQRPAPLAPTDGHAPKPTRTAFGLVPCTH